MSWQGFYTERTRRTWPDNAKVSIPGTFCLQIHEPICFPRPWELLLCSSCAAEGTHRRCSGLRNSIDSWECDSCAGLGTGMRQSTWVSLGWGQCPGWACRACLLLEGCGHSSGLACLGAGGLLTFLCALSSLQECARAQWPQPDQSFRTGAFSWLPRIRGNQVHLSQPSAIRSGSPVSGDQHPLQAPTCSNTAFAAIFLIRHQLPKNIRVNIQQL